MPYSSGGRPATALSPMFGSSWPSYDQTSVPSSFWMSLRREVLVLVGQVAVEHVGRLDDVVVDADEDQVFDVHVRSPSLR